MIESRNFNGKNKKWRIKEYCFGQLEEKEVRFFQSPIHFVGQTSIIIVQVTAAGDVVLCMPSRITDVHTDGRIQMYRVLFGTKRKVDREWVARTYLLLAEIFSLCPVDETAGGSSGWCCKDVLGSGDDSDAEDEFPSPLNPMLRYVSNSCCSLRNLLPGGGRSLKM